MSDDLVERLRRYVGIGLWFIGPDPTCQQAANEITRLRHECERLLAAGECSSSLALEARGEAERLTAAVEDAIETLESMGLHTANPLYERLRSALERRPPDAQNECTSLRAELEASQAALKVADDSIRHHLRSDTIAAALIQPHAVKAIRQALLATIGTGEEK